MWLGVSLTGVVAAPRVTDLREVMLELLLSELAGEAVALPGLRGRAEQLGVALMALTRPPAPGVSLRCTFS